MKDYIIIIILFMLCYFDPEAMVYNNKIYLL